MNGSAGVQEPTSVIQPVFRAPLTPMIARRLIRYELSRMCDNSSVTHGQLGARLGTSRASVSQILSGVNLPSRAVLEVIVRHLGQSHRLLDLVPLLDQARKALGRRPSTRAEHDRELELGLEARAESITAVSFTSIPGLLFTGAYLRFITGKEDTADLQDLERRRQVLAGPAPIRFSWFTDEPFLHRLAAVTPASLIREQLNHLLALSEADLVHIRLLPISATPAVPPSPFRMYRFSDGYDCALEDTSVATHYTEDLTTLAVYNHVIERLDRNALSTVESRQLVRQALPPATDRF